LIFDRNKPVRVAEVKLSTINHRLSTFLVVGCVALAQGLAAEGNSSLSESKTENEGTNDTVVAGGSPAASANSQPTRLSSEVTAPGLLRQNEDLQRQLLIAQESLKALTSSLAESNAEAELFRRKYSDLQLQMEALGLASANKDRAKLEQRLLAAVSDLQLARKERDAYRDQMLRLDEAMLCYLKTAQSADAKARMDVETQLRSIDELVTKSTNASDLPEPSLMDGSVISVKDEWSFVVGNLGEKQGVKIGMPMRAMRGDKRIATLRIIDVRQRICGAVVQEMDSKKDRIKVGDRLQVDAQPNVSLK
jgi:predicted  nucleic acid-binding Zn-ribbon protein